MHDVDRVGHPPGKVHGVRHHHHRLPRARQVGDDAQHLRRHARVEGAGGFIEQDGLGLHRQGAGDGDALLLAARELFGPGIELVGQADTLQQATGLGIGLDPRRAQDIARSGGDILAHRQVRKEMKLLEHHANPAAQATQHGPHAACRLAGTRRMSST